jgi:hypothetical protein
MVFANNLMDNLIVIFILVALFVIIYCKVTNKTLLDIIKEIKGGLNEQN